MTKHQIYGVVYNTLDYMLRRYDPCRWEGNQCIRNRTSGRGNKVNGCCNSRCKYLGEFGCTTQNLPCKIEKCYMMVESLSKRFVRILELSDIIYRRHFSRVSGGHFKSQEEFMRKYKKLKLEM